MADHVHNGCPQCPPEVYIECDDPDCDDPPEASLCHEHRLEARVAEMEKENAKLRGAITLDTLRALQAFDAAMAEVAALKGGG